MNKCPNCGRKLSPFYFKTNCPDCGINLLYYNLSESLVNDRINAEREQMSVNKFLYGIKISTIGTVSGIVKLALVLCQLALLLLPMFKTVMENWVNINLLVIIQNIIAGSKDLGFGNYLSEVILSNNVLTFSLIAFMSIVIFVIICLIIQLFCYKKWGRICSIILEVISCVFLIIMACEVITAGGSIAYGYYINVLLIVAQVVLIIPLKSSVEKKMIAYCAEQESKYDIFLKRVEDSTKEKVDEKSDV